MKIILVTGVIGSGKDYFVEQYKREHPDERVEHLKFATPIVDLASRMFGLNLHDKETYEAWKAIPENRKWMVDIGQSLKAVFGKNIFAKATLDKVEDMVWYGVNTVIVSDFRFPIEFQEFYNRDIEFEIHFTDFKSERYKVAREQVTEGMAIWLLSQGYTNGASWNQFEFKNIIDNYVEE